MLGNLIDFHEEAAAEYEAAVEWYSPRSEAAARKFAEEITKALDVIAKSPFRWPVYQHQTRRILLRHFPFALIYLAGPSRIQVVAVAHGQRRPGYWKSRV